MIVLPRTLRKAAQAADVLLRRFQRYFAGLGGRSRVSSIAPRPSSPPILKKPVGSASLFSAELAQLDKILASEMFMHSTQARYRRLLRYIVENSLQKKYGQLKESSIAVNVFGR